MSRHFFPMTGKPPCSHCGQPEGVILNVSETGFSCGSGHEHEPECPALRCPHGVVWLEECPTCENLRDAEGEY